MQLATGSLHKTPNILEDKGGLGDTPFDNAHDKVPQHGRQNDTKDNPTALAPTKFMDRDIDLHSMDSCARNLGDFRMSGCILLHHYSTIGRN